MINKGFTDSSSIETPNNINITEKTKPITPKIWGKIQTATLSYGHGLSISPIQMIEASSKLFNNNLDYKTQIHKKNKEDTIEKTKFLSEGTIDTLKYLMYENTLNGTARNAKLNGFKIGGKTATGEKAAKGKTPTDSWWHTIVSPNSKEKTGYPTQKPMGVLNRIIRVHSNKNDKVLDFFAGAGTTGEAAIQNKRNAILIDNYDQAIKVMKKRFEFHKNTKYLTH